MNNAIQSNIRNIKKYKKYKQDLDDLVHPYEVEFQNNPGESLYRLFQ